jgi:hypothetical protein
MGSDRCQDLVVLVADQVEVFAKAGSVGIGYVATVEGP